MANVTETPSYDAGIYQIETTDPVLGGPNGIANAQAKGLANRTAFLKQQIDQLNSGQLTPAWIASQDYVQEQLQKLDAKQSVRAATVANITLSGAQTIDGVALTVGERVLVKDQNDASKNGIYLVSTQAWTRSADADDGAKLNGGATIPVNDGTLNSGKVWRLVNSEPVNIGTSSLVFFDEHAYGTKVSSGLLRIATEAEAIEGVLDSVAVAPKEMKAAMEALLDIVAPIGLVLPWVKETPPNDRFVLVKNQVFDPVALPKLAKIFPGGQITCDPRGLALRFWDGGRGRDPGRLLLSEQGDAMRPITGGFGAKAAGNQPLTGPFYTDMAITGGSSDNVAPGPETIKFDISRVVPTAPEFRMANWAPAAIMRVK